MPLSKTTGNMYEWCSHKITHLGGRCEHKCTYCYTKMRNYCNGRYDGSLRLVDKELKANLGSGRTIFVGHMTDMWADMVPSRWIEQILEHCRQWPDNEYVFQTKNPIRFFMFRSQLPPKRILGCTIETESETEARKVSVAPRPYARYMAMQDLVARGESVFVTVEPILKGDMAVLALWLALINPKFVNIGADSKGSGLIEPSGDNVRDLVKRLTDYGIEIREKRNLARLLDS